MHLKGGVPLPPKGASAFSERSQKKKKKGRERLVLKKKGKGKILGSYRKGLGPEGRGRGDV